MKLAYNIPTGSPVNRKGVQMYVERVLGDLMKLSKSSKATVATSYEPNEHAFKVAETFGPLGLMVLTEISVHTGRDGVSCDIECVVSLSPPPTTALPFAPVFAANAMLVLMLLLQAAGKGVFDDRSGMGPQEFANALSQCVPLKVAQAYAERVTSPAQYVEQVRAARTKQLDPKSIHEK